MVSKYENLSNEEIIMQYKINKEIERARNREAYEQSKLNKVKYRTRLTNAYNNQVERMNRIKKIFFNCSMISFLFETFFNIILVIIYYIIY